MTTQLLRLHASLRVLTAILLGLLLLNAPAAQAAPFAYITNQAAGTVSVIDIATNTVTGTVPVGTCLLYTSPSPRDRTRSRMPSSA